MIFNNPKFLWGFLTLLIPIIIHLFNFRRYKKVYFSNTKLLDSVIQKQKKVRNLKQFLILATRLLALMFLVLAFARPILPSVEKALSDTFVNIYLDNSLSTTSQTNNGLTGLENGVGYVKKIIELYPKETKFKLLTNDFLSTSNVYLSRDKVEDELTEVSYSKLSRKSSIVRKRLLKKNQASTNYWVSDFQRTTFSGERALFRDTSHRFNFIPLTYPPSSNVYVDSVYLESSYLSAFRNNMLKVSLKNNGGLPKEKLHFSFTLNAKQQSVLTIDLKPNQDTTLSFSLPKGLEEFNLGQISLDDSPIGYDNEYYFVIKKPKKIKVLEIKESEAVTDIERVYGNEELYQFSHANIQNLDYNLLEVNDVIVLNQIPFFESSILESIKSEISKGKTVILITSLEPDLSNYQKLYSGFSLIPSSEGKQFSNLAKVNYNDPFFEGVFSKEKKNFLMPKAKYVLSSSAKVHAKLSFENGIPFLFESPESPNLKVFSAPFLGEYTNFHEHSLFVPVMYHLATNTKSTHIPKLSYAIEEQSIPLDESEIKGVNALVMERGDQKYAVYTQKNKNQSQLNLPKEILSSGFYNLEADGKLVDVLAFNTDKNESLLEQFTIDDLKEIIQGNSALSVEEHLSPKDFSVNMKEKHEGKKLWFYALMISLLFLLSEILLIRFFRFGS